jgi:hypothetical protein
MVSDALYRCRSRSGKEIERKAEPNLNRKRIRIQTLTLKIGGLPRPSSPLTTSPPRGKKTVAPLMAGTRTEHRAALHLARAGTTTRHHHAAPRRRHAQPRASTYTGKRVWGGATSPCPPGHPWAVVTAAGAAAGRVRRGREIEKRTGARRQLAPAVPYHIALDEPPTQMAAAVCCGEMEKGNKMN